MEEELQVPLEGPDDPIDEQMATQELESQDLTPDEAAASLSFANGLAENMMPQVPEMAQEEQITEETTETPQMEEADIEAIVEAKVEEKIGELREQLTSALAEEEDNESED